MSAYITKVNIQVPDMEYPCFEFYVFGVYITRQFVQNSTEEKTKEELLKKVRNVEITGKKDLQKVCKDLKIPTRQVTRSRRVLQTWITLDNLIVAIEELKKKKKYTSLKSFYDIK